MRPSLTQLNPTFGSETVVVFWRKTLYLINNPLRTKCLQVFFKLFDAEFKLSSGHKEFLIEPRVYRTRLFLFMPVITQSRTADTINLFLSEHADTKQYRQVPSLTNWQKIEKTLIVLLWDQSRLQKRFGGSLSILMSRVHILKSADFFFVTRPDHFRILKWNLMEKIRLVAQLKPGHY